MAQIDIEMVSTKAKKLGFTFQVLSGTRRLIFPGTGFGYQGTLDGCMAYMQGWEEHIKHVSSSG